MHVEQHLALKKLEQKSRKKSRFRFFQFLAKNRDFRFRIRESSITTCYGKSLFTLYER